MIQAESITIHEFRGIRNLTLNLGRSNYAVCGPNGTGKSGIVDALEFALTGNISRLSGRGAGVLSLKDHAPHVDSRARPDKAAVTLTVWIPSLKKRVTIVRTVKAAATPIVTPNDPEALRALARVAGHPEFVLSRRELIRYVLSTPGDRAKEVQALLRLDEVEDTRAIFNKIANACQRSIGPLQQQKQDASRELMRVLEMTEWGQKSLLEAVNKQRTILELPPIDALSPTTSLKDGLTTIGAKATAQRIPKVQALSDIQHLKELVDRLKAEQLTAIRMHAIEEIAALQADPTASNTIAQERLLQGAINLIENDKCPVCDTTWEPEKLRELVREKLRRLEAAARKRKQIGKALEPVINLLSQLDQAFSPLARYCAAAKPPLDCQSLLSYQGSLSANKLRLEAIIPFSDSITALRTLDSVPTDTLQTVEALESFVKALPEPTKQDAARDCLTAAQERLDAYRDISRRLKQAEHQAKLSKLLYEQYVAASTEKLNAIYRSVENDFADLYRFINREDEGSFAARLTPSLGKLGFDVDFYGRGHFPPGAYHSEGHQDSMGLCLYLALMKHLLGESFSFAVLDDVLMSVDAGHRREVSKLLMERFPGTQFILTTHDDVWLKHMKAAGLISGSAFCHFRKWDVDHGPTEWEGRDLWNEINEDVRRNDIHAAAALLRHFLEHISREICHRLRARVEFRGDAQFQLGDLLPNAVGRFRELLKDGAKAAQSWGQTDVIAALKTREQAFATAAAQASVEQWQINPAVHYNEWANFTAADFGPVVAAQRALIESFMCDKCNAFFYVVPERGPREILRCSCGLITLNLKSKK